MATSRWITKRKSQLQLVSVSELAETITTPTTEAVSSTGHMTIEAESISKKSRKKTRNEGESTALTAPNGVEPSVNESLESSSTSINPYCDVIQRRLRTLRKRMAKIEKYEGCDQLTLNLDQVGAISKKEVVATTIKELEDMLLQLEGVEEDEYKQLENLEKEELIYNQRLWLAKETKLTMKWEAKFSFYYRVLYILDALFINHSEKISNVALQFTDAQFNALLYLRSVLAGVGLDATQCSLQVFSINAEKTLGELMAASDSEFINGITFAAMNELLEKLFSPPAPPVFGTKMNEAIVPQVTNDECVHLMPSENAPIVDEVVDSSGFVRTPLKALNAISFINPSEIITDAVIPEHVTFPETDAAGPVIQPESATANKIEVTADTSVDKPKRQRGSYRGRGGFRYRGGRKKPTADVPATSDELIDKQEKSLLKKTSDGFKVQRPSAAAAHQGEQRRRPRPPKAAAAAQA